MGVGLAAVVMTGGAKNPVCRAVVFWEAVAEPAASLAGMQMALELTWHPTPAASTA